MRFATQAELQSLFEIVPIQDIVRTEDCFEDVLPQDHAIMASFPSWVLALGKPSAHSVDAFVSNPDQEGQDVKIRIVGVVASDGVFGIFSKTTHSYSMLKMQVVDIDPAGKKTPRVRSMRSVEMELCGLLTQPALPEVLELRASSGPTQAGSKAVPRI